MESAFAVVALPVGLVLVAVSAVTAALYTPYTTSRVDTAITAFIGVSLQLGSLVATSSAVLFVFGSLGFAGFEVPLLVQVVLAYAASHLTIYVACLKVTSLQEQPIDPGVVLQSGPLRLLGMGADPGDTAAKEP
jgi:drug/metabolite transporter (DMT)-like permease